MATTYEKTWAFDANRSYTPASALDATRYTMWYIAAFLTGKIGGMTLGLWTLYASSDSVTAGTDATDRWVLNGPYDGTKIVRSSTAAHSWIVLKSPTMNGANWYLTISFYSTLDDRANISFSKTAPSGGSTTATPFATGSSWYPYGTFTTMANSNIVALNDATNTQQKYSSALTSGGDFYVLVAKNGNIKPQFCLMFHALADHHGSDLYPVYGYCQYSASSVLLAGGVSPSDATGYTRHPLGTSIVMGYLYPPVQASWGHTAQSPYDGTYPDLPWWMLGFISTSTTIGMYGLRGRVADLAACPNSTAAIIDGSVSPSLGQPDSVKFGCVWLPANVNLVF